MTPLTLSDARADKVRQRLFSRVARTSGCWEWTGPVNNRGYGITKLSVGDSVVTLVHRISFLLASGFLREDLCVCHRCDNRRCVRPDHLFAATVAENQRDMLAKDRQSCKLSRDQVRRIRAERDRGITIVALARRFGVDHTTISRIARRRTWRHV